MSYGRTIRDELGAYTRELRRAIPGVYQGYRQLHDAALTPGALDTRTKELIALAIAVSKECDGRIADTRASGASATWEAASPDHASASGSR